MGVRVSPSQLIWCNNHLWLSSQEVIMKCLWHICTKDSVKGRFCDKKCQNKYYVDRRRKAIKLKAITYKGSKCSKCGYDKCIWALEFHHRNPDEKEFSISYSGHSRSWERVKNEIDKCDLVCANCHREIESMG